MKALIFPVLVAGMMTFSSAWAAPATLSDAQLDSVSAGSINVNAPLNLNIAVNPQVGVATGIAVGLFGSNAVALASVLNLSFIHQSNK